MRSAREQIGFLSRQLLGFRNGTSSSCEPAQSADLVAPRARARAALARGVEVRRDLAFDGRVRARRRCSCRC